MIPTPRFGNLIIVTREMSKCCFDVSWMDGWALVTFLVALTAVRSSLSHPRNFHHLTN
jgi:hypothetical protein